MGKGRYQVNTSNDLLWIEKAKSFRHISGDETKPMKALCLPSRLIIIRITTEPPNPQEIHLLGFKECCIPASIDDICMKHAQDMGIPVWVCIVIFMSENHDICMGTGIKRVLRAAEIICCVIDTNDLVLEYAVIDKQDLRTLCCRELCFIAIISVTKYVREEVIFQPRKEVLYV